MRNIAELKPGRRSRQAFEPELLRNGGLQLAALKSKGAKHPSVANVLGRILASLKSVGDAFGVSLHAEIDRGNNVGNDSGTLLNSGNQRC